MNAKFLLAAVAALSLASIGAADAAAKHKRHKQMVHRPASFHEPVAPVAAGTRGPIWAGPNECYTDEGYGRFWPCGAGKGE
jgi:hypothetical protein